MASFLIKEILALAVLLPFAATSLAQDAQSPYPNTSPSSKESLKIVPGQDTQLILDTIGEPDRKTKNAKETEFWYYGSSTIIIAADKVQAVNDTGDLRKRKKKLKVPESKNTPGPTKEESKWSNPWTAPDDFSARKLVDLLKDP